MMWAIVRSLLRSRLPLPLLPLCSALFIRAMHSGRVDWRGSDLQGVLAALEYLAVIPMLGIVLATGWFRGEIGAWSWALARPIARTRWLGVTLLVDVTTLVVSVLAAYLVIGELPDRWVGPWPGSGLRELGYAALLAIIHCAAAFAGARGASAIGGSMYAVGFVGAMIATRALATMTSEVALGVGTEYGVRWHLIWRELTTMGAPQTFHLEPLDAINALGIVLLFACVGLIVLIRTGRCLPARPRLAPSIGAIACSATIAGVLTPLVMVLGFRGLWY